MFVTPLVLRGIRAGYTPLIVGVSALLWLFAQTYLPQLAGEGIEAGLRNIGLDMPISIFFNIFAWQVLFLMGLYAGSLLARGKLNLQFLKEPGYAPLFYVSLLAIGALAVYDRLVWDFWISPEYSERILAANDRQEFGGLYLIAFLLDLFAVTWLLVAGPESRLGIVRRAARFTQWLFTRKPLVFLGQHSLQVFSFHILVVYLLHLLVPEEGIGEIMGAAVIIMLVASLYIPAAAHAALVRREKAANTDVVATKAERASQR
jgi:hypothetical protein